MPIIYDVTSRSAQGLNGTNSTAVLAFASLVTEFGTSFPWTTAGTNVTIGLSTDVPPGYSDKVAQAILGASFTTGLIARMTTIFNNSYLGAGNALGTFNRMTCWIKSSAAVAGGVLKLRLTGSSNADFIIQQPIAANVWTPIRTATTATFFSPITGFEIHAISNPGTITLLIQDPTLVNGLLDYASQIAVDSPGLRDTWHPIKNADYLSAFTTDALPSSGLYDVLIRTPRRTSDVIVTADLVAAPVVSPGPGTAKTQIKLTGQGRASTFAAGVFKRALKPTGLVTTGYGTPGLRTTIRPAGLATTALGAARVAGLSRITGIGVASAAAIGSATIAPRPVTAYPGGYDTFIVPAPGSPLGGSVPTHTRVHKGLADALAAVQTTLGLNPQGSFATVAARLTGGAKFVSSQTSVGTLTVDMANAESWYSLTSLAGNLTVQTVNCAAGRIAWLRIFNSGPTRTLTFPAGWFWTPGSRPATITRGQLLLVRLESLGTADTAILADYSVYRYAASFSVDPWISVAQMACSVRRLVSAYTGPCLRVQRSSDSTQTDIGWVNEVLDIGALMAFVGSGTGYVVTWYDQSGNGRNFTAPGSQPVIVNAGSLVTRSGVPAIQFSGSQSLQNAGGFNPKTIATVGYATTENAHRGIFSVDSTSDTALYFKVSDPSGNGSITRKTTGSDKTWSYAGANVQGKNMSYIGRIDTTSVSARVNGANLTPSSSVTSSSSELAASGSALIGGSYFAHSRTDFYNGTIQEVICFSTLFTDSDLANLERDQGNSFDLALA